MASHFHDKTGKSLSILHAKIERLERYVKGGYIKDDQKEEQSSKLQPNLLIQRSILIQTELDEIAYTGRIIDDSKNIDADDQLLNNDFDPRKATKIIKEKYIGYKNESPIQPGPHCATFAIANLVIDLMLTMYPGQVKLNKKKLKGLFWILCNKAHGWMCRSQKDPNSARFLTTLYGTSGKVLPQLTWCVFRFLGLDVQVIKLVDGGKLSDNAQEIVSWNAKLGPLLYNGVMPRKIIATLHQATESDAKPKNEDEIAKIMADPDFDRTQYQSCVLSEMKLNHVYQHFKVEFKNRFHANKHVMVLLTANKNNFTFHNTYKCTPLIRSKYDVPWSGDVFGIRFVQKPNFEMINNMVNSGAVMTAYQNRLGMGTQANDGNDNCGYAGSGPLKLDDEESRSDSADRSDEYFIDEEGTVSLPHGQVLGTL